MYDHLPFTSSFREEVKTSSLSPKSCQREARDVVPGRARGREVGQDFADRRRELEAVAGAGRRDHDLRGAWQAIDDEIAVRRHRVETGLGFDQRTVRGRQMLG